MGPIVDADWALYHLSRVLWDPIDPRRLGSLEDSLQYRVNGEVYRFASAATLRRFMRTPELWAGVVRDPITTRRFVPSSRSPAAYWFGGPYFFESESTKAEFLTDPVRYQIIRRM
ncbi:MAG: hypothetical protein HOP12_09660 [Candidatus Eisenbacteria bacterium]|uniref:YHS domain-containing protein n=1 Tax=Eiseniibacteriota bacterium TaxID=2212470 RepID=A0A849SGD1_UNCEI|nr:hypothetical protein [Candidatus Eisenbacteria bacterium]